MQCSHPIQIPDPDNKANMITIRCGHCRACRIEYQNQWKIRAEMEMQKHDWNMWCALTYDPVHLSLQNLEYEEDVQLSHLGRVGKFDSLEKQELKLFWKRFRKAVYPIKVRYMQCGEYGDKFGRPHYHCIIFGMSPDHKVFKGFVYDPSRKGFVGHLPQWPFGEFWYSEKPATLQNAAYLAKYIHKKHKGKDAAEYYSELNINPEFFSVSTRPGIGSEVIDDNADYFFTNPFYRVGDKKMSLPRYAVERLSRANPEFKAAYDWYNAENRKNLNFIGFNGDQQERNLAHVIKN